MAAAQAPATAGGTGGNATTGGGNGTTGDTPIGMPGLHGDGRHATPATSGAPGVVNDAAARSGSNATQSINGGAAGEDNGYAPLAGTGADTGLGVLGAAGLLALIGGLLLTGRRRHT